MPRMTYVAALAVLILILVACEKTVTPVRPDPPATNAVITPPLTNVVVAPPRAHVPTLTNQVTAPLEPNPKIDGNRVTFRYKPAKPAETVFLTGWFNGWTPDDPEYRMRRGDDGWWTVTIRMDAGRFEYKFVIDGRLVSDHLATEQEPDGSGGKKSLVTVHE